MKMMIWFEYRGNKYFIPGPTAYEFAEGLVVPQIGAQIQFLPVGSTSYIQKPIKNIIYSYDIGPGRNLTAYLVVED